MIGIGHRGAAGHYPENTLLSVEQAVLLGARWVEVDVWALEGELVVIHDDTLDRTTSGTGPLNRQTLAGLRSLDAGQGEKVPLLREVMERLAGKAGLHIELKGRDTAEPLCRLIREITDRRLWRYQDLVVSSFHLPLLHTVRRMDARIPLGALIRRPGPAAAWRARFIGARSLHVPADRVTDRLIRSAHRHGLQVLAYTVNDPEVMRRLESLGIDGLFTDFPDRIPVPERVRDTPPEASR